MTPAPTLAQPPCETIDLQQTIPYTVAPPPRTVAPARRPARLSWDQFLLGQLAFVAAIALIVGTVAFAMVRTLPVGASLPGRQTAQAATTGGTITAFVAETAAQQVRVAADPVGAPKWDKPTYEAQAGDVTFVVTNDSPLGHNFAVEGPGVQAQSPNFAGKTTNSYTLKGLKPGEYLIVCTFAGHREAGMVAKLIVK